MKNPKEPHYNQRLKKIIGERSVAKWIKDIQYFLRHEEEEVQKWTAQVIVNNYPAGAAYHTALDEFSDPYGSWSRGYEYINEDLERAFLKLGLPYEKSEYCRKQDGKRGYERRSGANKRKDTHISISKIAELHRFSEANKAIKWNEKQMEEAG